MHATTLVHFNLYVIYASEYACFYHSSTHDKMCGLLYFPTTLGEGVLLLATFRPKVQNHIVSILDTWTTVSNYY